MSQVNRRNFIKLSATAGAALAIAPVSSVQGKEIAQSSMPMRTLGRTGYKLPILSMGVMRADNVAVVRAAYNSGIVFFDTANGYQNGRNEEMLGNFFADKPRNSFYLATKVRVPSGSDAGQQLRKSFDTSMSRLKLSYVDILYCHGLSSAAEVNNKAIMDVLLAIKKEGKVKFLGVSTHSNEPEVINACVDNGNFDVVLTSYNFGQKHLDQLNPAIERAAKAGLGIVAMKTMAGGRNEDQEINVKAALKWAWQNPNIHTAIPGFTTFDQLEECVATVNNLEMTAEEKKFISVAANQPLLYCQGCRICEGQCSKHLPIPEMMRAYMYNYGYRSAKLAKEVISELNLSENPCGECASCSVKCTNGFQVAKKIKDITRLQNIPPEFLV